MTEATMPQATITEEMIASMQAKAGIELRIDHSIYNEDASRIAVLRFVEGIGEVNPLWADTELGEASPFGAAVAPPSFVMGCFSGLQFGWPGLGSFHSESTLRFHRPIYIGDRIKPKCIYQGFSGPKPSSFADQIVIDHFHNEYTNQRDELVAEIDWSVINYERGTAIKKGAKSDVAKDLPHVWTEEALVDIEARVLAEAPRGSSPRYWEGVAEGDELDELTRGPIGTTDEVAFVSGGGAPIPRLKANGVALRDYQKHPAWAFRDPDSSALEPIYAVHYNKHAAVAMGVPLQYDVGFQRQCWHINLITHWMGDNGWCKSASAQYRSFVYHGDVIVMGGKVEKRYIDDDGEHCVDVSTWARNQRGQNVMPGSGTIVLPSKDTDPIKDRARS
ncbi:MAG: MaoC family dehydratase N-terminal domain-containing protein [Gammaproteobacteria bacterium]|nr:MaoC family dehydratase N-terminal domain-containing protein [Gammaproteobacteria bacterium]